MGIRRQDIEAFNLAVYNNKMQIKGLKIMQFGDEDLRDMEGRATDYFKSLGCEIINIDINGEHDALPIDLSQPIRWKKYKNYFDVVTNYGTLEHVKDDKMGYRNADYFLKSGGLMFNIAPVENFGYKYHKNCHKYNLKWFIDWAKENKYSILSNKIILRGKDNWIECILRKD